MPRYEFSEGSSNKFWEIKIEGSSVVTTYGKIGSDGQSTMKDWGSAEQARKEFDKLVASKTKKGYRLAGGGEAAPARKTTQKPAAAPKPAGRAAGASAAAPVAGQRYELSEGSSNKFWQIKLEGSSVVTTYGKIGSDGQSTMKEYDSPAQARSEHDKLIASKVKKGYQLVSTGGGARGQASPPVRVASNPKLEAAILDHPDDDSAYLVYADWLQSQGDPRGELITIQHGAAIDKKLRKAESALLAKYGPTFLPARLAEMLNLKQEKGRKPDESHRCQVVWKNGFLQKVRLARSGEDDPHKLEDLANELLAHASARFLQELEIGALGIYDEYDYSKVAAALVKGKPACLRKLYLADFWTEDTELSWSHLGNLSKLWAAAPRLEELTLRGGSMTLGNLELPALRSFRIITGGLDKAAIKSVCAASWPRLESLHLYFGNDEYGGGGSLKAIAPILEAQGLSRLKHLGLMNADFTDEICQALPGSRILKQLSTLDLSLGTMSDQGAAALLAKKAAFKHLQEINLSQNFLTKKGIASLKELGVPVISKDQKEPYDWDEDGRYVSVSE